MTLRTTIAFTAAAALHVAVLHFAPPVQALQSREPVKMVIRTQAPVKPAPAVLEAPRHVAKRTAAKVVAPEVVKAPVTVESADAPALVQGDAPVAAPAVVAPEAPKEVARAVEEAAPSDPNAIANYRGSLHARLASMQRYPLQARRMHIEGVTTLVFRVGSDGQLMCPPRVVASSHPLLDAEALRMVQAAAPFPPRPRGINDGDEIRISINFTLSS